MTELSSAHNVVVSTCQKSYVGHILYEQKKMTSRMCCQKYVVQQKPRRGTVMWAEFQQLCMIRIV